jgi:hypothetical protein
VVAFDVMGVAAIPKGLLFVGRGEALGAVAVACTARANSGEFGGGFVVEALGGGGCEKVLDRSG